MPYLADSQKVAASRLVFATANNLAVPLPEPVTAAITARDNLKATAAEHCTGRTDQFTEAALTALEAGKDPAADKNVIAALVRDGMVMQGLTTSAANRGDDRVIEALAANADEIINTWADALDDDAELIATAAQELPEGMDPYDSTQLATASATAIGYWVAAKQSLTRFGEAVSGWQQLTTIVGGVGDSVHPWRHYSIYTSAFADDVLADKTHGQSVTAWDLARAGHPLRLATFTEYHDRVTANAARREQLQASAEQADHDALTASLRFA